MNKGNENKKSINAINQGRIERVIAAIYLVTDLMSDDEPMRHKIRSTSVDILSIKNSAVGNPDQSNASLHLTLNHWLTMRSLLSVLWLSEQLSVMNYRLIISEIDDMISAFESSLAPVSIEHSALESEFPLAREAARIRRSAREVLQNQYRSGARNEEKKRSKTRVVSNRNSYSTSPRLNSLVSLGRRETIIGILKGKDSVSIKDITGRVKDMSAKMVQREVIALVKNGQVLSTGNRRWRRYKLAPQTEGVAIIAQSP